MVIVFTADATERTGDGGPTVRISEHQELTQKSRLAINALHDSVPGTLIYTTPRFVSFLEQIVGKGATWLLAHQGDELVGVAPYFHVSSAVGTVMSSLPFFGSNGFPIGRDAESVQALLRHLRKRAESVPDLLSWVVIENPFLEVSSVCLSVLGPVQDTRIGQFSDLSIKDLKSAFDSSRRRNIQKAASLGAIVSVDQGADALGFLAQSHALGMRDIGGRIKPAEVFRNLVDCLSPHEWRLATARIGGERVAALLTLRFGETVEYFTPTVLKDVRDTQVLSLLVFEEMLAAQRDGFQIWNWGGTWLSQRGVYDYKKRWGARERPYRYFIHEGPALASAPTDLESTHHHFPYCYVRPLPDRG